MARRLHREGVVTVHPTWTTRPSRADEPTDTVEHRFVSDAAFDEIADAGGFAAVVTPFGLPYRYGLPRPVLSAHGPIDAFIVRAPFVGLLRDVVPTLVVYRIEVDASAARERLQLRGRPPSETVARSCDNEIELAVGARVADRVFGNRSSIDDLVNAVRAALRVDVRAVA